MKEYIVKKTTSPLTVVDERWANVPVARVDYVWDDFHPSPFTTEARLVHSEDGLTALLSTHRSVQRAYPTTSRSG